MSTGRKRRRDDPQGMTSLPNRAEGRDDHGITRGGTVGDKASDLSAMSGLIVIMDSNVGGVTGVSFGAIAAGTFPVLSGLQTGPWLPGHAPRPVEVHATICGAVRIR